uniref:Uncharacterized protein n=1 Tax=viral metagenome TaxID=1070528 RepID=A0A6M3MAX5_9ZZZZ
MAAEYKVIRISEMLRAGEGEGIVKVYRHTIKTRGGTILNVEVSEEDFTPEKVAPILQARAEKADKILKL